MNYFIDFEATQFNNEIIAVGCICEDGRVFYSLVRSNKKITSFITKLTGITTKEIQQAEEPEIVFEKLWSWCSTDPKPHFYCYGTTDKNFVRHNFQINKNFKAAAMLSYLYLDLEDYTPHVREHFGLCKPIGLQKVYNYCTNNTNIQKHNALEDAIMLKDVYNYIQTHPVEKDIFIEYQTEVPNSAPVYKVSRWRDGELLEEYNSMADAVNWCFAQMPEAIRTKIKPKTVREGIKQSQKRKKRYRDYRWKVELIK